MLLNDWKQRNTAGAGKARQGKALLKSQAKSMRVKTSGSASLSQGQNLVAGL
jgi:hypothetical protein